ncbi:MAG: hypothetical protein QMD01_03160 [Thermodesulfovibrionales bacterium]|nr:hypothetical protein [Thermodesulfovibrionales bacterium]
MIITKAKQARLQSLYQCDKILRCLFILFNAKVILKRLQIAGGFGAAVSLIEAFSSMPALPL